MTVLERVGESAMPASQETARSANPALQGEIVALIHRSARLTDDQKYLDWMDLFADDGVYGAITNENYTSTGLFLFKDKSKSAIHERVAFLKGLWQAPRGKTLHLITNIDVEVDPSGDTASAFSYFMMTRTADMEHSKLHACGRYLDKCEKHDGGWLFKERIVVVDSNMLPGEFTELL
jgi:3-phenylpropionate/cinnamic acid dioxygenase small subunit